MTKIWTRWPDEPAWWYDRFMVYCNLGANRTLDATYRIVAQREGLKTAQLPAYWRAIATRWEWANRALAWDADAPHPINLTPTDSTPNDSTPNDSTPNDSTPNDSTPNDRGASAPTPQPTRRSMIEQLLAIVFGVLVQADLDGMSSAEARRVLPTLRLFFKDLLAAHRLEQSEEEAETTLPPFTADELQAAQVHLAKWQAELKQGQSEPPASPARHLPDAGSGEPLSDRISGLVWDRDGVWFSLRDALARLYPDEASARRVAAQAGLDSSHIAFGPRAVDRWHGLLTVARHTGRLGRVVEVALHEYGGHADLHAALATYAEGMTAESTK